MGDSEPPSISSVPSYAPSVSSVPSFSDATQMPSYSPTLTVAPSPVPSVAATISSGPTISSEPPPTEPPTRTPTFYPSYFPTKEPTPEEEPSASPVTDAPSPAPMGQGTVVPLFADGFEDGTFPTIPWMTDSDNPWALSTTRVYDGEHSIKSPDLANAAQTPAQSYVTLVTNPAWPVGSVVMSVYVSTEMPFDRVDLYVDGNKRQEVQATRDWQELDVQLSPGPHTVELRYLYNPANLLVLPPSPTNPATYLGAVFVDNVYFLEAGTVLPPSPAAVPSTATPQSLAPTPDQGNVSLPPIAPLDPNPDSFETGSWPVNPWFSSGDGDWTISTVRASEGTSSLQSPDFDGSPDPQSSNATLILGPDFGGGVMNLVVWASVFPPQDLFVISIDGITAAQFVDVNEWQPVNLGLSPGEHRIDFRYEYNTFGVNPLPPRQPQTEGAVWIDSVEVIELTRRQQNRLRGSLGAGDDEEDSAR